MVDLMKSIFFIFSLIMTVLFFVEAPAMELIVAYENKEQPPYYMGNTTNITNKPGVAVEMIQNLGSTINGLDLKLKRMPWKRCKKAIKHNKVHGIFNASYKKSRLELGWYPTTDKTHRGPVDISRRITNISYSFYKLKGTDIGWNGKNYNYIKGTIGAPLGYSIVGDIRKKGGTVYERPSTIDVIEMLLHKRYSVVALQDVTAASLIKSIPDKYNHIERITPPIADWLC